MKIKYIIVIFIVMFLSTGCSDYRELNNLGIVTAISIDKTEDGYKTTMQFINTQKADSTNIEFSSFITIEGYGKTIKETANEINLQSSKSLYLSHLSLVIIDEKIAKDDIEEVLDILLRGQISRTDFNILISKNNKASDILQIFTAMNNIPATKIVDTIKEDFLSNSNTINLTFLDLLKDLAKKGNDITIPSISIIGNKVDGEDNKNLNTSNLFAQLTLSDIGIFDGKELIDYITNDETKYFNILKDEFQQGTVTYKCVDDNYMTIMIDESSVEIKPVFENDKFKTNINLSGSISIYENNCKIKDNIEKLIEDDINNQIKNNINSLINKTKDLKTDIFGFGHNFYLNNYKTYQKYKDDWKNIYSEMEINIITNYKLITNINDNKNIVGDLNEN